MKYSITISDLEHGDLVDVIARIEGQQTAAPVVVVADPVAPTETTTPVSIADLPQGETVAVNTAPVEQAPPVVQAAGVELDGAGMPHDERIHSGSKSKKKDGTWSRRRGITDELFDAVEKELWEKMNPESSEDEATKAVTEQAAPAAPQPAPEPLAPVAPVQAQEPAPVAATAPPVAPPAMTAPQPAKRDFQTLMTQITSLFSAQKVSPDYPTTIVERINKAFVNASDISAITDIASNANMVEYAWQCLDVDGKAV